MEDRERSRAREKEREGAREQRVASVSSIPGVARCSLAPSLSISCHMHRTALATH
jgi:hypothetical protein